MFAITAAWSEFLVLAGAGIVGAIILGLGRTVMGLVRTRQAKVRADESDARNLSVFFFDQPRDERTGTPATIGWTTKIDAALDRLTRSQEHTTQVVNKILYQVEKNGGGNMRGAIDEIRERGDNSNG